jgi:DNA repair exonuclease SbcCD ATPase subunit
MRIAAITAHESGSLPAIDLSKIRGPLTAIYGPAHSGKTVLADLVGHALFGKVTPQSAADYAPNGELLVEAREGRYRIRRNRDASGRSRLTVAALDGAPVDHHTIRNLSGGLSPAILGPLCAVSFREPADIARLLSHEFVSGFQRISGEGGTHSSRRVTELAARRDLLAQELESRIATERRASKDLEARWRELDRLVRDEQQQAASADQRLKAVENSLAETDARLRYRRLELNVELQWHAAESTAPEPAPDLGPQIARCREMLAGLNERELAVRANLAQLQTSPKNASSVLAEQQTWLAVSRQLAADLTGEVSRLARASASKKCVCHDAHPRLRPIAETIDRQLAVLEKSLEEQRRAVSAAELQQEVDNLVRVEAEMRRQLEHLLDRSQTVVRPAATHDLVGSSNAFSAADAEQLESRRLELEHERFQLAEQVNAAARKLKILRSERDAVERQRAAILSARSIEHVQRELADIQRKLENSTNLGWSLGDDAAMGDYLSRASDFLAQLTNGDLSRLTVAHQGQYVEVVNRNGESVSLESLHAGERDQVYLSLCLALLSAASRHGVWLPLVLDDPFERLDARGTAALAVVLNGFCREGHQVLVFTRRKEAAERLTAIGAEMHDMMNLRQPAADALPAVGPVLRRTSDVAKADDATEGVDGEIAKTERSKRKVARSRRRHSADGHSDAA